MELEGAFSPTRNEFIIGAIASLMTLNVASKGVEKSVLDDYIRSGGATVVKAQTTTEESEREKRLEDAQRTKSFFFALKDIVEGNGK